MNRKDESLAMQIAARREADRLRAALRQTRDALQIASDHLDSCGWGDIEVEEKVVTALKAADDALNT